MINVSFIADGQELRLPVTPMFSAPAGKKIETVNINEVGDVNIAGKPSPASIELEGFFPASNTVPYAIGSDIKAPYEYVQQFITWAQSDTVVRYVVTDTTINLPVLIESIEYSEQDGTGDVYYTISMVEYTELDTPTTEILDTGNDSRADDEEKTSSTKYTVKKGDTLSAIAKKYYGDSSMAGKIATVNNISNPNLIFPGQVLDLPGAKELEGVTATKAKSVSNKTMTKNPASYTTTTTEVNTLVKDRKQELNEKRQNASSKKTTGSTNIFTASFAWVRHRVAAYQSNNAKAQSDLQPR